MKCLSDVEIPIDMSNQGENPELSKTRTLTMSAKFLPRHRDAQRALNFRPVARLLALGNRQISATSNPWSSALTMHTCIGWPREDQALASRL